MNLKGIFGFCEHKGCKKRVDFDVDIIAHFEDGTKKIRTVKMCKEHALQGVQGAELKSVTVENTINMD